MSKRRLVAEANRVIALAYTLRSQRGEVLDGRPPGRPLWVLLGTGALWPELEEGLQGMAPGQHRQLNLNKRTGNQWALSWEGASLEAGMPVAFVSADGVRREGWVAEARDGALVVSEVPPGLEAPMVLEALVMEVRRASEEELAAGRALVGDDAALRVRWLLEVGA